MTDHDVYLDSNPAASNASLQAAFKATTVSSMAEFPTRRILSTGHRKSTLPPNHQVGTLLPWDMHELTNSSA